ncbi:IclR family transcriptional regulator [Cryobacterium frigoriphilum]|uniref:IclR family transcriptional regulator n=1 Tax=Cryobacterium frigoriphilum TaxID=1259150 RepID=A0A4R9A4S9_9MICO|nr:IclR family transcriptional regulator [Cryobacterium frigoriphilum]TFD52278.1 IclR family transcriptional regulator [Cryobacterium frigoriphilum]
MDENLDSSREERTAVDKALSLLSAFGAEADTGIGVSELARRSHLSKSTAFRLLGMLERNGAVERAGTNYRLGPLLHSLGSQVYSPAHDNIRNALTPYLMELYETAHQTVHLAVLHGTDVIYLNKLFGHRPLRSPSRIGGRVPAYCTGVGKVLLAYNFENTELTLARPLSAWTPKTITDPDKFRAALAKIRAEGIGYDDEESVLGLSCVAAPILGPNGKPIAALSISGQTGKFSPASQAHTLRKVCFAASRALAATAKTPRTPAANTTTPGVRALAHSSAGVGG